MRWSDKRVGAPQERSYVADPAREAHLISYAESLSDRSERCHQPGFSADDPNACIRELVCSERLEQQRQALALEVPEGDEDERCVTLVSVHPRSDCVAVKVRRAAEVPEVDRVSDHDHLLCGAGIVTCEITLQSLRRHHDDPGAPHQPSLDQCSDRVIGPGVERPGRAARLQPRPHVG